MYITQLRLSAAIYINTLSSGFPARWWYRTQGNTLQHPYATHNPSNNWSTYVILSKKS